MNQNHRSATAPRLGWLAATALTAVCVLGLGACGDDDDPSDTEETPTETQTDAGDAADDDGTAGDEPASDDTTDAGVDLGIETRAEAMAAGLDAESYEVVDDSTVRFVLSSGTSEGPVNSDCMAAEAMLDDVEITMVYPDGEVVC